MANNDNDLFSTTDAQVWAKRFVERVTENPAIPTSEGAMLAWFAGAIETGRSVEPVAENRPSQTGTRSRPMDQTMREHRGSLLAEETT